MKIFPIEIVGSRRRKRAKDVFARGRSKKKVSPQMNVYRCSLAALATVFMFQTASAATMEQIATIMGQLESSYNRARFLCLAAGIPMETYAQHHPDRISDTSDLKSRYPEHFALGEAKGFKQANNILSGTPQDLRDGCALFSKPSAQKAK